MKRILVLFAHPAPNKSRINSAMIRAASGVDGVTIHDLYERYPDFDVDPAEEQELLLQHDVVVLQFPFYWYSTPALIKQWEDLVLQYGWAYGSEGTALRGKQAQIVTTTGGGRETYGGDQRPAVEHLLAPLEHTFRLCGMAYQAPYIVYGTHKLTSENIAQQADAYARFLQERREAVTPSAGDQD